MVYAAAAAAAAAASVVSDSVQPRRRQPTRLPSPCDSPGKSAGVGCHCLLRFFAYGWPDILFFFLFVLHAAIFIYFSSYMISYMF